MDKNKAIDILCVIAPPRTSKKAFYDFMQARDMAIEALEQLTIIHCKDCRWNDGTAFCNLHYRDIKGKDFCSWAEERSK